MMCLGKLYKKMTTGSVVKLLFLMSRVFLSGFHNNLLAHTYTPGCREAL